VVFAAYVRLSQTGNITKHFLKPAIKLALFPIPEQTTKLLCCRCDSLIIDNIKYASTTCNPWLVLFSAEKMFCCWISKISHVTD